MTGLRRSHIALLVALLALVGAQCFGIGLPDGKRLAVLEAEASAAAFRAERDDARRQLAVVRGEASGLRGKLATAEARLRGLEERGPVRIVVYDTVISLVHDTVVLRATVGSNGRLTLIGAIPDSGGSHRPRALHGIDVRDCDDGLDIIGNTVICNRPRFGHLSLYAAAAGGHSSLHGSAGLHWQPSFRSGWSLNAGVTTAQTIELRIERRMRLW